MMPFKLDANFSLNVDEEIVLRIPAIHEAQQLFSLIEKKRNHLREFLGWVDTTNQIEDSKQFIEENLNDWL